MFARGNLGDTRAFADEFEVCMTCYRLMAGNPRLLVRFNVRKLAEKLGFGKLKFTICATITSTIAIIQKCGIERERIVVIIKSLPSANGCTIGKYRINIPEQLSESCCEI